MTVNLFTFKDTDSVMHDLNSACISELHCGLIQSHMGNLLLGKKRNVHDCGRNYLRMQSILLLRNDCFKAIFLCRRLDTKYSQNSSPRRLINRKVNHLHRVMLLILTISYNASYLCVYKQISEIWHLTFNASLKRKATRSLGEAHSTSRCALVAIHIMTCFCFCSSTA